MVSAEIGSVGVLQGVRVVEVVPGEWEVVPVWAGVDRQSPFRCGCLNEGEADRLAAAYRAGAAYREAVVREDRNGFTYVAVERAYRPRTLNADLAAVGF